MHANFRVRSGNRAKFLPVRHRARGELSVSVTFTFPRFYTVVQYRFFQKHFQR